MRTPAGPLAIGEAFSVRDLVVLVTGAGGRIGSVIAEAFAVNGSRVVVSDRSGEAMAEAAGRLAAQTGAEVVGRGGDLRVAGDLRGLVELAGERFGRLDAIVHCGAIINSKPLRKEEEEAFERVFETNVRSMFLLAKYAYPLLEASRGSVTTVASVNGHRALFRCPLYAGSKAAVLNMSRTLAAEFGGSEVRFNTVSPGLIRGADEKGRLSEVVAMLTPPHAEAFEKAFGEHLRGQGTKSQPLPVRGGPGDVAMACVYLASPAARFVTGADLLVDGGMLHMFEDQIRETGGRQVWARVREHLLALPEEAWQRPKPQWLTV